MNDWTPNMVGTHAKPKCKTKGAETWSLLLFLVDELTRLQGRVGENSQRLMQAGRCLSDMVFLWRQCPWSVSAAVTEDVRAKLYPPSVAKKHKIHPTTTTKPLHPENNIKTHTPDKNINIHPTNKYKHPHSHTHTLLQPTQPHILS